MPFHGTSSGEIKSEVHKRSSCASNEKYKKAIYIFSSTYEFSMTISKLECCDLVSTWHVQVDKCLEYT